MIQKNSPGFHIQRLGNSYQITFNTLYAFGDLVEYNSEYNDSGQGHISDIVLSADGSHYYYIELDNGEIQPGIYPQEIRLIRRGR